MLYGTNTYVFRINSDSHNENSLRSRLIFGPFRYHLYLLRNLRSNHMEVEFTNGSTCYWMTTRQRTRLEFFVEVLKQHADDDSKMSLLQTLHIQILNNDVHYLGGPDKYMFALESLAALRGIEHVTVVGLPSWFAECLKRCIQGKDGDVQDAKWPRRRVVKNFETAWISTRKWYQPMFDWREFADRNGIATPDDIGKYFKVVG